VEALNAGTVQGALKNFATVDEIAIVAVPGALDPAVQTAVVDHCENMGDRFAILDGQRLAPDADLTVAAIQGGVRDSNYAALYYPWIQVYDPASNQPILVPPSGHMAGIYARVDTLRGVHKAPANEVIRGALGVERRLGRPDQDGLNPLGINVIRQFDSNVTVWGARTLGGDRNGEWKYINVRRLFLFLRKSIDQGTQWVVFEPNAPDLWAKIVRNVTAFLTVVWRNGALFGASPAEAFFVKCDAETNPPEVRDLGQVITEIGVAVVKPAEFVIFRISQWAGPSAA
jgi:phage tail sheath protein FI